MTAEFAGKRVVVMGLGRFGGGVGVTRWLCGEGARVVVSDAAAEADLGESLDALKDLEITYHLGGHDDSDLDGCDLLVVNPAVDKRSSGFFQAAVRRGIAWTSEMNVFLERCPGRIVGVTGTVGKSTTTAMIGAILDAAKTVDGWRHGQVWLGGNIGRSLLDDLNAMTPRDIVVLELSSFQLEDATGVRRSPHVALVTNVRDNHLDRHGSLAAYAKAKGNIYRFQSADDWLVLPLAGGVECLPAGWAGRTRLCRFGVDGRSGRALLGASSDLRVASREIVEVSGPADRGRPAPSRSGGPTQQGMSPRLTEEFALSLTLPGMHNIHNAAAALCVSRILGVPDAVAMDVLARFGGLAHRLEFVREHEGVKYYNDSKATTPEAAMTSLRAFDGGVVVLVGGSDKGSSFAELGRALAARAKAVICMGATQERIRREIKPAGAAAAMPTVETAAGLREGLDAARRLARPGDVVLLSPACASFDWFKNYEDRGDSFKAIVNGLT